ncbi:protein of unknown function [Taphrina deformans PYCC 5710]|uniref:Peptidase M3A/M3B catalytic domain-containing protein n=1 Tax=Taphrina deformans (strain PYCC 5710 / ATCC 11124 / CBS 356.35 / IMI 108563 / JCM 9778 / NBRC 8474) TaxID=1097556 RepID=R4XI50_TAPDE|nr:protein of unknown function [Taphrina deformans PYCC 5710]|eukprot:CCG84154.1 protein of unknown function [Taphrina deformans PYCC 5710]
MVKFVSDNQPDLNAQEQRLLDLTLRDAVRNGLALPTETQHKVLILQQHISSLTIEFMKNLAEDADGVWFNEAALDGVPAELYQTWPNRTAGQVAEYQMSFRYPDVGPTIRLANLEATRRTAWLADNRKVSQNAQLMADMITARNELKTLKGYRNYADYALADKMAKNTSTVQNFLQDLRSRAMSLGQAELASFKKVKAEHNSSKDVMEWDRGWALSLLLEKGFNYNTEKISEYFEMDNTIKEMLTIFETLFNLSFTAVTAGESQSSIWHEDVRQFSVRRRDTDEFAGWLYMDLFPREGKFGHAANIAIRTAYTQADGRKKSTATALVCNLSKPTKLKPSLLKHGEVRTLFHELGHGIHSLMVDSPWYRFNVQDAVELDFNEAPSQMLENWCYSSQILKRMSRHYLNGTSLDDGQIKSIQEVRRVGQALGTLRGVALSLFDLKLHTDYNGTTVADLTALWNSIMKEVALQDSDGEQVEGFNSFMHIMGGYEAGYYSYLYSEVFSADMYRTMFLNHEMDPFVGAQYRDIVLKPGGSKDALVYLTRFLGRPPNSDAFLQDLGLSDPAP